MNPRDNKAARDGFSLVEVAVTTVIVGLGVTALLLSIGAGSRINGSASQLTQAVVLAQEIREWTLKLPFSETNPTYADSPPGPDGSDSNGSVDDLDDMMDVTYCPPRDGQGVPISSLPDWSQKITETWRDPNNLTSTVAPGASDVIHVQVDVACHGQVVYTTGWIVTRSAS